MKTYSLVMAVVCGFLFSLATLGTVGDLAFVVGGPRFALDETEARRYSDFGYFRAHQAARMGRHGDRIVLGDESELRAQWESHRENVEMAHGEAAALELLRSLIMFVVFGGLFFAHLFAFQAYGAPRRRLRAVSAGVRVASKPARVRKLRAKAATRRASASSKPVSRAAKRPTRKAA